ncbi:hypothetical protein CORT_0A13370 [Candida orthopsilosis Co 90-125]|uniref:Uncharacterized protein n=1 Tax=Candida orthopsilosis (strain 90-125) TaxID=1136231 RepID=H8WXP7_CANO9|nr:hypothetical protein CORT_0A13370 [Candida orthopsilosis Co 90-125]CCG21720.1 hypothetical protein CORT_0A13370 [Candida orthopsilosis Co 90-125]
MNSSDTLGRMTNESSSMNPISPTILDNLSMDLKERRYRNGLSFNDEVSSPSIVPKTPKSNRRVLPYSSPMTGGFSDLYSQSLKRQHSPKKSIISPSKNYSESVSGLRAARGSPVKSQQKAVNGENYKWSPKAQIDSLKDENTKLHRDLEKAEYYRKESTRLQKELEKLENIRAEYTQAQKDVNHWKLENEHLKDENSRLKSSLDFKGAKLTRLQLEIESLTEVKKEQVSIIGKKNQKITDLRKSLDLALSYCSKWEAHIDKYVSEMEKLRLCIQHLKEEQRNGKAHSSNMYDDVFPYKQQQPEWTKKSKSVEPVAIPSLKNAKEESHKESRTESKVPGTTPAFQNSSEDFIAEKIANIILSRTDFKAMSERTTEEEKSTTRSKNTNEVDLDVQRLADELCKRLNGPNLDTDNTKTMGSEGTLTFKEQKSTSTESFQEELPATDRTPETKHSEIDVEQMSTSKDVSPPSNSNATEEKRKNFNWLMNVIRNYRQGSEHESMVFETEADPVVNCETRPQTQIRESSPAPQFSHHFREDSNQSKFDTKSHSKYDCYNGGSQPQSHHGGKPPRHHKHLADAQTQTNTMLSDNEYTKRSDQQPKTDGGHVGYKFIRHYRKPSVDKSTQTSATKFFTAQVESLEHHHPAADEKEFHESSFKDEPARTDPHFMHAGSTGGELSSELKHVFYCKGPGDSMCTCPACCASGDYTNSKRVWVSEAKIKT